MVSNKSNILKPIIAYKEFECHHQQQLKEVGLKISELYWIHQRNEVAEKIAPENLERQENPEIWLTSAFLGQK